MGFVIKLLGTGAAVLLVLLSSNSEWPEPKDAWTRLTCGALILAAIWL